MRASCSPVLARFAHESASDARAFSSFGQPHPRRPAEEAQQYVKNGSRAIRGRVFPEYVCIEDVDKIISSVQRAPEEAAGPGGGGGGWGGRKAFNSFTQQIYSYRQAHGFRCERKRTRLVLQHQIRLVLHDPPSLGRSHPDTELSALLGLRKDGISTKKQLLFISRGVQIKKNPHHNQIFCCCFRK